MEYERGLVNLDSILKQAGLGTSDEYLTFVGWRRQLQSSIVNERNFAVLDPQEHVLRERILRELDRLSLKYVGKSFMQLCQEKKYASTGLHETTTTQLSTPVTRKVVRFKLQLGRLLNLEFETRVLASPMGEPVGNGKSPYTQEQLVTVLKALQASQYQEQDFTPTQRDALKQLGLLTNPHFAPNLQQRIGETLFEGLLADQNIHTAFQVAMTQARANNEVVAFQLRFDEDVTELARYPWELLHDGRRALLPSGVIELTRYISYPEATTRLSAPAPLRLLYITSRPNNLSELPPDTERQATRESLQTLENDGQLHIDDLPRATYNALVDYLDTYKPHILHFDGHGRFHRQCHVCRTFYYPHITQCENCTAPLPDPQGYLAFEQENGEVDWISSETLGHLFNSSLRLAVLSACYSGTVRGESLFGGVGPALIQAGVPAVVATQLPISVDAAREFAKGFYRALARYESLATAVNAGRRRLFTTKEWFIPVLYLRSQDDEGQLFIQP